MVELLRDSERRVVDEVDNVDGGALGCVTLGLDRFAAKTREIIVLFGRLDVMAVRIIR